MRPPLHGPDSYTLREAQETHSDARSADFHREPPVPAGSTYASDPGRDPLLGVGPDGGRVMTTTVAKRPSTASRRAGYAVAAVINGACSG
jgi:hypothetical protein